jgi:F-type H+-transporting ATPase subunit epsilon
MADTLSLEVVTPQGSALKENVEELTAPSISGEFGVLPGHLPILAAVKPGLVTWKAKAGTSACAVGWGFIEVSQDRATLLTDHFVKKGDVDPVRVRADLKDIQHKIEKFDGAPESPEFHALVNEELWCAAQLELHGDPPPATIAFITPYGRAPDQPEHEPSEPAPATTNSGQH